VCCGICQVEAKLNNVFVNVKRFLLTRIYVAQYTLIRYVLLGQFPVMPWLLHNWEYNVECSSTELSQASSGLLILIEECASKHTGLAYAKANPNQVRLHILENRQVALDANCYLLAVWRFCAFNYDHVISIIMRISLRSWIRAEKFSWGFSAA